MKLYKYRITTVLLFLFSLGVWGQTITDFSPKILPSEPGISRTITITGSGFGNTEGEIKGIWQSNGGILSGFVINSWSDTQIKFEVPLRIITGGINEPWPTFTIIVHTSDGTETTATQKVLIPYALARPYPGQYSLLTDQDGAGGITFHLNADIERDHPGIRQIIQKVLCIWTAAAGINWRLADGTVSQLINDSDGINVIAYDEKLRPTDYAAMAYTGNDGCSRRTNADVGINPGRAGLNINYSEALPKPDEYDFISTLLHELGHTIGIDHTFNTPYDVMNQFLPIGQTLRVLSQGDIDAAKAIQRESLKTTYCGKPVTNYTCPITPCIPSADFTKTSNDCSGKSFNFFDKSFCSNDPYLQDPSTRTYSWTFSNTSVSKVYTSTDKNPTILFDVDGFYDVTLKVTNQYGTSTITKASYFKVGSLNLKGLCSPTTGNQGDWLGGLTVNNVTFNTIHHPSSITGDQGYHDLRCDQNTIVTVGKTYDLIASLQGGAGFAEYLKVYIDYNNDGIFDTTNELVASDLSGSTTVTKKIVIDPSKAMIKNQILAMRVIGYASIDGDVNDPCHNFTAGDVEDYGVIIVDDVPTCPNDLTITTNVASPNSDTQQGSQSITATNTINSGATANYHAGADVLLKDGFVAVNGSDFRAYIQGCTGTVTAKRTSEPKTTIPAEKEKMFAIYPNPSTGIFTIEVEKNIKQYNIDIFSSDGRVIYQTLSKDTKQSVDISNVPSGLYLVIVSTQEGKRYSQKIIKK